MQVGVRLGDGDLIGVLASSGHWHELDAGIN